MGYLEQFIRFVDRTSEQFSGEQWVMFLAGISLVTYILVVFGGRTR